MTDIKIVFRLHSVYCIASQYTNLWHDPCGFISSRAFTFCTSYYI